MGRYHLARKFGQQTLDLAALDESERSRNRYINLKAEMLWEDGLVEESQALLREATAQIESRGVHILEELAALSRYNYQLSLLGGRLVSSKLEIDEALKKNHFVCSTGSIRAGTCCSIKTTTRRRRSILPSV